MIAWILGRVKWLFLVAAVGGPVLAYIGYSEATEIRDVMARGRDATALIDSGTIKKGRKSGTSYTLNLSWDEGGGRTRTVEKVSISSNMADAVIVGDKIVRDKVKIKYLADAPDIKPVIVEDAARRLQNQDDMLPVGVGAGVVGAIGAAFMLMRDRKKALA
jgi:hypothetical protein